MPHRTHFQRALRLILIVLCTTALYSKDQETSMSDDDLEAFLDNPEALFQILGDEQQTGTQIDDSSISSNDFLLVASLGAGVGHSDNFLKKYAELEASDYVQIEFDAFASWKLAGVDMSALVFAETTLYDFDLEPSEETITFGQLTGMVSKGVIDYGFEGSFLYGSFIYDSSLTAVSAASGTEIRQVMPKLELFADWYAPGSNRIRFSIANSRNEFNIDNQDYWNPELGLELEHAWTTTFLTTSFIEYSRQLYDDGIARTAGGEPIPDSEKLEVDRVTLGQKLFWKPQQWKWLQVDVTLGIAWEDENAGSYEAMRQSWIQGRMNINNAWGRFKFSAKWGEYRYDERQVSFFDPQLHLQTNRTLTIEYSRSLPWQLRFVARSHWSALNSRIFEDTYSERRSEVLLQWSY